MSDSEKLFDLSGRNALITGSSRGLGLAMARGLAEAGAKVILNGRNEDALQRAVKELTTAGLAAEASSFDVTDSQQIARAVANIEKRVGPIDILFNNAGIQRRGKLIELSEQDWREVIDTNLTAGFLVAKCVVPGMIARKRGKIVNICSLMSEIGRQTIGAYTAAKGGLKMLTRAMCVEWAGCNIQINAIGPGYFRTEMTEKLAQDPKFNSWITSRTPAGRWGEPKELIGPAIFLASEASSFVNGQILYVDGGILASL